VKQAVVQVFDDHMADLAPREGKYLVTKYTSLEHTEVLTSADQIGMQVVVDVISASLDVPLTVTVEHSGNGYDWKPKSATPEISKSIPSAAKTITLVGGERRPVRPSQRFVRLRIDAGDSANPFAITLKLYVSARGREERPPLPDPNSIRLPEHLTRTALLFGVRDDTLREIQDLVLGSQHLDGAARYDEVIRGMSAQAKREVSQLVGRLRGLDPDSKQLLVGIARGVISLLSAPAEEAPAGDAQPTPCTACEHIGLPESA